MLFKKCTVATVLTVAIATVSFALVANDASFGVADAPDPASPDTSSVATDSAVPKLDPGCPCSGRPDCNGNCEDDRCDVDCSASGNFCVDGGPPANDLCYAGHFPSCGTSADCTNNNVPDECEGPNFCCTAADCGPHQCCGQIQPNKCSYCIE